MGSLKNLYISQSYQGLLHLASNSTASATLELIEDGLGNSLGLYLNNAGDLRTDTSVSSSTIEATNLVIKNKIELTGSIDIDGPVTASTAFIEGDLIVSGTLFSSKVVTLIESSSIIYSSGSNILGDEVTDTQTLIGTVIISGSQNLTGSAYITGEVSSSTVAGIGNVTAYSESVDNRLDIVEATASLYVPFSQSVDNRLDEVETTASFLNTTFSQSVDFRLDELENWSSSLQTDFVTTTELTATASFLQNEINKKLDTASFEAYTQSFSASVAADFVTSYNYINSVSSSISASLITISGSVVNTITNLSSSVSNTITNLSSSIAITDNAQTQRIISLEAFTSSYATSGSNTYNGNQIFSGSVIGRVIPLTISSNTASMDCSLGNFFSLNLVASANTYLNPTNINPGQTIQLLIKQVSPTGSISYPSNILFPTGSDYSASILVNTTDILSFTSFDTASLYGVSVKNLV